MCAVALAGFFGAAPVMAQDDQSPAAQDNLPPDQVGSADARCISLNTILQTEVVSDHEILMTMRDRSRVKLSLAGSCPQLEFQVRFTYGATAGQLCAGRDRIITRSGDACLIQAFQNVGSSEQ